MAIVTNINRSEFEFINRIDSELYNPNLKISFEALKSSNVTLKSLKNLCYIKSGTTPTDRVDGLRDGPILFKTADIRNNTLSPYSGFYHISLDIHNRMRSTQLQNDDVLLNIVGATLEVIGRSAIYSDFKQEANITQAMVSLRIKNTDIKPGYLFAYLQTRFAQDQIKRFARPTGQYNLNLTETGQVMIPLLEPSIQLSVHNIVKESSNKLNLSFHLYSQATQLLEKELGLEKMTLENELYYSTKISRIITSKRTDSQHLQPKFEKIIIHLKQHFAYNLLGLMVSVNRRGIQPIYNDSGTKKVITSQHITSTHLNYDNFEKTTFNEFYRHPEAHVQYGDILVYTTGAYVGQTNVYLQEEPALASNHVNILRLKKGIDPAFVALVLNTMIGKTQTEKNIKGSAQAELYPNDLAKFIIPFLDKSIMKEIGDFVRDSLKALIESKRLLAQAKTEVETLIEQAANKT